MNTRRQLGMAALAGLALARGPAAQAQPAEPTRAAHYRDGTYTAKGQYGNLPSFLTVTVKLKDDRITSTAVKTHATDPTSLDYQRRFAAAVPAAVRGKLIADVKVGRLAGSSGCPTGFNAALDQIRAKAALR
jgi:uncharacterized protein with FMN-binding domain